MLYYNARFYDPYLNQWVQPDTVVPNAGLVADYNRYSYVRNNPLRYVDETGHTPWDVIDVGFWLWSAKDFLENPSWANAGWLAVDTVSLLPLIPSAGWFTRGGKVIVNLTGETLGHGDEVLDLSRRVQNSLPAGRSLGEISLASLETIQRYGIDRAGRLQAPAGQEVHHLVEKRFFQKLGFENAGQADYNILGVILDTETHRLAQESITKQLRQQIGYGAGSAEKIATGNASLQQIWNAHRDVYEKIGHQDWAELIWETYFQNSPGIVK